MSAGLWVAIAALGGAGAVARVVGSSLSSTTTVNIAGAFVLGLLTGLSVTGHGLLLAGSAFLGSLTTFSTWMLEARTRPSLIAVTQLAGVAAAGAGWALGSAL